MSQVPFPGHGQGGSKPRPGSGAGNGTPGADGTPGAGRGSSDADDNFDLDARLDRLVADADAGRIQIPDPGAWQGLAISLAEVTDPAAASLAGFAQGGAADSLAPGAALLALAETACAPGTLGGLDDNQVLGLAAAGKRIAALGAWIELSAASQFAGRRRTGDTPAKIAGETLTEFAGDELAPELGMTPFAAAQHLGYARDVTRRLPVTFAALHAGRVDGYRVKIIAEATQWLSDDDAAEADQVLAVSAAELTYGRLRNAAARLVVMLDPGAAARRKDEAASNGAAELLRRLKVQLAPIAKGTCDHAGNEPGYRPSRKLRHLINARTARCHFRGCSQPAVDCDADHTVPWPGPSCQCNLGPTCKT